MILDILFKSFLGLPLIAWVGLGVLIFIIFELKSKLDKKEKEFVKIPIEQRTIEDIKQRAGMFGYNTNYYLRVGFRYIGRIKNIAEFKSTIEYIEFGQTKRKVKDAIDKNFYLLKILDFGFIPLFKAIFLGKYIWFIIDTELIEFKTREAEVNPNHQAEYYNGVWIFSNEGKEVLHKIVFKSTLKEMAEGQINFLPKLEFIETKLSNIIARKREDALIEKEKYKGQTESAEEG
jgi:hypothetical protein